MVITEEPSVVSDLGRRGFGDADIEFGIDGGLNKGIAGDGTETVPYDYSSLTACISAWMYPYVYAKPTCLDSGPEIPGT